MNADACPCCGQQLPVIDDLRIDDAGFVICNGAVAALTKQEAEIFLQLRNAAGRVLSKEKLHSSLYRLEAETEIKIVDVFICKLRKKLTPLGLSIETIWGSGYRFIPITKRSEA